MLDKTAATNINLAPNRRHLPASLWTDEKIARLKEMRAAGSSYSEIGDALGFTRRAIGGKIHRLGLDKRARAPRRGREPYTPEIAEKRRLARQKDPVRFLEYRQRWISNPDNRRKYNVWQANRRARERNADGSFSLEDWLAICAASAWKCLRCGEERPLSIDHVLPLSMGGSNYPSNLQPLCQPCNAAKGNRHIDLRVMAG